MRRVVRTVLVLVLAAVGLTAQTPQNGDKKAVEVPAKAALRADSASGEVIKISHRIIVAFLDPKSGQWIRNAEVIDSVSGTKALTSVDGAVSLEFLTPVRDSLGVALVRKVGYNPLYITVKLTKDAVVQMELEPQESVTELPTVVSMAKHLTASMQKFENRRNDHALHGAFLDSLALKARSGQRIETVLPNADTKCHGPPSLQVTHCKRLVYLDGQQLFGTSITDALNADTDRYQAAEFYGDIAFAPHELVGAFSANVSAIIVLWSRGM